MILSRIMTEGRKIGKLEEMGYFAIGQDPAPVIGGVAPVIGGAAPVIGGAAPEGYRPMRAEERLALEARGNVCGDWSQVFVRDPFLPELIRQSEFHGRVLLGRMEAGYIEHHDLRLPLGIVNSLIVDSQVGDRCALRNVSMLSRYDLGEECIVFNVGEMVCTDHAKFGNGLVMEGEAESVRVWIEAGNENAGRRMLAFDGLQPADAWIWTRYRGRAELQAALLRLTESGFSRKRLSRGQVGHGAVIKDCCIIKDALIDPYAYIKGANKIKNVTIHSSAEEVSQIGEGVELVNGIVGHGNRIFYGSKAVRFVTGRNVQLKYGARLLNSILGDNSTVSCCELLNNLIFPFHEQHHNNSFLIAATILGQSNVAAGATIGSNHNSRAPDGEILAGRGFWPGLATSFKHNCRFASFVLVASGRYSQELNVAYPFSLVSRGGEGRSITISPGFWFTHNMYAMARNSWKFRRRDQRVVRAQHIETDYAAPDTMGEALAAMERLEDLAAWQVGGMGADARPGERRFLGRSILLADGAETLSDPDCQRGAACQIRKPSRGYRAYREALLMFGVQALLDYSGAGAGTTWAEFTSGLAPLQGVGLETSWANLGGQLIGKARLDAILSDIEGGTLADWPSIHARYDLAWERYPEDRARFALFALARVSWSESDRVDEGLLPGLLREASDLMARRLEAVRLSRQKDYTDPFRKMMYSDPEEMRAVLGQAQDSPFLIEFEKESSRHIEAIDALLASL